MTENTDTLQVKGSVIIVKTDAFGNVEETKIPNLVVTLGKYRIASRLTSNTSNVMSHMSIGSGTTPAAPGDTALGAQLARVALSVQGGTPSNNTVTYSAAFPAGTGTGAITEAGVFDADANGVMLCRTVFSVVNKTASDSIAITWVINIT